MKKLTLLIAFLFTVSSSFISCRDNNEAADEVVENDYDTDTEVFEDDEIVETGFDEYDYDDDRYWDEDEFSAYYEDDWDTWDLDDDGWLDEDEYYTATYNWVDVDGDGIDETEWDEGYNNLYGDYVALEDFDDYDLDDDGIIDEDEWTEGWADTEWFGDYDVDDDQLVSTDEFNEGLFDIYDEDDDELWDEDEYETFYAYYDTW